MFNRRVGDLESCRKKGQEVAAELEKIRLAGTIVLKSFLQRRIFEPYHFNAELEPNLSFQFNADPTFYVNADLDLNPAPNQNQRDAILSVTALPMAHLIFTDKLDRGPFFKLNFKGIPSQDKQKTDLRCLMILCTTLIG